MFAVAALAPHVVLPTLAVVAAVSACVFVASMFKKNRGMTGTGGIAGGQSFLTHLEGWSASPEMHLIGRALALRLKEFGDNTGHALLDGLLLKALPASAPFLPTVNKVVNDLEGKIASQVKLPSSAAAPAAAPASTKDNGYTLLKLPKTDHPFVQLLLDVAKRYEEQESAKVAATK